MNDFRHKKRRDTVVEPVPASVLYLP